MPSGAFTRRGAWMFVAAAAALGAFACRSGREHPVGASEPLLDADVSVARFDALNAQFSWPSARGRRAGARGRVEGGATPRAVFRPEHVTYVLVGEALVSSAGTATFARRADGALALHDVASDASAEVLLVGAKPVAAEIARGHVVYRGGAPNGGDVIAAPIVGGAEDWVTLDSPSMSSLVYEVRLGAKIAGLRLVANVLELVDRDGAPRLRMAAPEVVDARGSVLAATTSVEGCAVDTDPRAPFGRDVVSPGKNSCLVRVEWDPKRIVYPAIVDPAWMVTARMAAPRHGHVAVALAGGDVLVAGGQTDDPTTTSIEVTTAEIYSNGAWAQTGSLATSRDLAAAAILASGEVLVSGGLTNQGMDVLASAEIYAPTSGTWRATGPLAIPRAGHSSTAVGDGTVLVAAGYDNSGDHFTDAELYDGGTFRAAGHINQTRYFHTAHAIGGGRVLVGGGTDPYSGALGSLELYTAGVGFSPAASLARMRTPRTLHASAVLPNGDVLFAGGHNAVDGALVSSERYTPSTNTWTNDGSLERARFDTVAAALPDGHVLFVAGQSLDRIYSDGELYDPVMRTFVRVRGASVPRAYGHTATALPDGRVLAAGGRNPGPVLVAEADLFDVTAPTVDAGPEIEPDSSTPVDASPPVDAAPRDASVARDANVPPPSPRDAAIPEVPREPAQEPSETPLYVVGGGCSEAPMPARSGGDTRLLLALLALVGVRRSGLFRRLLRLRREVP